MGRKWQDKLKKSILSLQFNKPHALDALSPMLNTPKEWSKMYLLQ